MPHTERRMRRVGAAEMRRRASSLHFQASFANSRNLRLKTVEVVFWNSIFHSSASCVIDQLVLIKIPSVLKRRRKACQLPVVLPYLPDCGQLTDLLPKNNYITFSTIFSRYCLIFYLLSVGVELQTFKSSGLASSTYLPF